jgi:hypothetical protein
MIFLACDPGIRLSHLCILDARRNHASFVEIPENGAARAFSAISGLCPVSFTVERPQVYGSGLSRKDDIVNLAFAAGELAGVVRCTWPELTIHSPLPREWKGQVPKQIHNDRVMARAQREGITVDFGKIPPGRHNHAIDALGLCFWAKTRVK